METRRELIREKGYWLTSIQIDVFNLLTEYMTANSLTQKQVAEQLGVSSSYVSQILNGNFNYTVAKLVELALAVGKVPKITFETFDEFIQNEKYPEHGYTFRPNQDGGCFVDIPLGDESIPNVDVNTIFTVDNPLFNNTLQEFSYQ